MSSLEDSLEYDSDNEIYSGPITKREVVARLKQNNFLTDDLLQPLSKFKDTDPLDAKLITFYDGILIGDRDYCNENESQFNLTDILGSVDRSSMEEQLKKQPSITLEDLMKEIQTPTTMENVSENYKTSETTEDSWRSPIKQYESKETTEASWISPQKLQLESLCLKNEVKTELASFHSNVTESELSDSIIIINDEIDHVSICSDSMQYSDISNDLVTSLEDTSQHEEVEQLEDICRQENVFQDESRRVFQDAASNPLDSSNISSSSLDDKSGLNDTLEEMKMFMKYGINYMNQNDSEHFSSTNNSAVNNTPNIVVACNKPILLPESLNGFSPIRVKTNIIQSTPKTPLFVTDTPFSNGSTSTPISHIQVIEKSTPSAVTPFSYKGASFPNRGTPISDRGTPSAERSTSVLKPSNRLDSHFKVPTKAPLSTKKSPKFNNIVSPIAMYIKNSPKVPLVKNIVRKHTGFTPNVHSNKKTLVTPQSNTQSEMKQVLPVRSYKPASRNMFMSKETEVALPESIRKLIKGPLNPEIVKHMGRVKATPDQYRIASPNPIAASDMTFLSSSTASEGIFNISTGPPGDISVLVSKSAARTNCLQGSQL